MNQVYCQTMKFYINRGSAIIISGREMGVMFMRKTEPGGGTRLWKAKAECKGATREGWTLETKRGIASISSEVCQVIHGEDIYPRRRGSCFVQVKTLVVDCRCCVNSILVP